MQRRQAQVQGERTPRIAALPGLVHLGALARRDVRGDRDAAVAAVGEERERGDVLAGQLAESSPQASVVKSGRARSQVASLTPTTFGSRASAAMVSTLMSTTERPGML